MSLPPLNLFRAAALLSAGQLLWAALPAQAAANQTVSAPANPGLGLARMSNSPATPPLPPPLPPARSPIGFFRDLLAMDPAARERALTNRPPAARTQILAKVREYESLKPDERELRLRVTELRWYLRPLMSAPATNRPAQLALVPELHRELVEARLQEWDRLSPDTQKELLANEATLRYLTEIEGRTDEQRRQTLAAIPPASRHLLEQGIDKWSAMAEDQRQKMLTRFREFFELTAQEKQKALNTLPGPERGQIEQTLKTFGNLPPEQRDQYLRSFAKFAGLSLAERQQFLRSAEHWKQMSPGERQVWRELVRKLPPPLPPGVTPMPPGVPPLPQGLRTAPRGAPPLPGSPRPPSPVPAIATNGY